MEIFTLTLSLLFLHFCSISTLKVFIDCYWFYFMDYLHNFMHDTVRFLLFSQHHHHLLYSLSLCFLCLFMASEMDYIRSDHPRHLISSLPSFSDCQENLPWSLLLVTGIPINIKLLKTLWMMWFLDPLIISSLLFFLSPFLG